MNIKFFIFDIIEHIRPPANYYVFFDLMAVSKPTPKRLKLKNTLFIENI